MLKSFEVWLVLLCAFKHIDAGVVPSTHITERPPLNKNQLVNSRDGVVVKGDCTFLVNSDLKNPAPLFAKHNQYELIIPEPSDTVKLNNGEYLDMYCTESFSGQFVNVTKISAQCLQNKYFLVNGTIYPFNDFHCTNWPKFNARRTGRQCNGGTDLVEVGFEVDEGRGFLQTYDVCHNEWNEVTHYVHHVLYPSSFDYQHGVARPNFITLDFYGGRDVNKMYTQVQQNITISKILGYDASRYFNFSNNLILSRGHMVAKTDQIFGAAQMSTFLFLNVAPQWQSFNGGNWERVETGVRKFVADRGLTVDCYTGTWGISKLPDAFGSPTELYLDFDENNNGLIPVPMLYFRVIVDRLTRKGIVLIGVNNPYASLEEVQNDYVICPDIGHNITWLDWYKQDLHEGYSYACTVPDFTKIVANLPIEDLHTTGVLGVGDEEDLTTNAPPTISTEGPSLPADDQCYFNVNVDLNEPAPIFTQTNKLELLQPNKNGIVILNSGDSFDMHCTGSFLIAPFNQHRQLTATCAEKQLFLVNGKKYDIAAFSCINWPVYETRRLGVACNGDAELVSIGFKLNYGFLHTLSVCHNEVEEVTKYTHYNLNASNAGLQYFVEDPNLLRGDFYANKNINELYKQKQQNATLSDLLQSDASIYLNAANGYYLVAGHLAAKQDFVYSALQRSTFYYINTAPQWQSLKLGNWKRIEKSVRKFADDNNLKLSIYAGSWGVATLPNSNGAQQELYLDGVTKTLPIPKIFFRILIDEFSHKGVVIAGVNNPHINLTETLQNYVICKDIGEQINWIDWAKEDISSGYSYACSVDDFIKTVNDLPLADLNTNGVLGIDENAPIVKETCSFRVNGDLKDPVPLFVYTNQTSGALQYVVPEPNGVVVLQQGETLDMYCSKSFVTPFVDSVKLIATCYKDKLYTVNGVYYTFEQFVCSAWPAYTARRTGRSCNGGTDLAEIGFILEGGFLHTFDACHDDVNEVTRYVHHVLNPSSAQYQRSVARPSFIPGEFYGGKDVNQKYTQKQQNITVSEILGMDASPYFNISNNIYLARGHLAAKTDFIFGAPQKATFFFINAAPQWQSFNGGNWERVEDSVRKFVAIQNLTTDCYTGTWGVSKLPNVNGVPTELYLDFDENNNGLIPVPMLYFRVIIDRNTRRGIVIIGVNNPHATLKEIKKDYIICKDIGHQLNWLSWNKEDLYKGYSYACSVPDFTAVVKDLPLDDLEVSGVLGIDSA